VDLKRVGNVDGAAGGARLHVTLRVTIDTEAIVIFFQQLRENHLILVLHLGFLAFRAYGHDC
jgi:hypothetical protein